MNKKEIAREIKAIEEWLSQDGIRHYVASVTFASVLLILLNLSFQPWFSPLQINLVVVLSVLELKELSQLYTPISETSIPPSVQKSANLILDMRSSIARNTWKRYLATILFVLFNLLMFTRAEAHDEEAERLWCGLAYFALLTSVANGFLMARKMNKCFFSAKRSLKQLITIQEKLSVATAAEEASHCTERQAETFLYILNGYKVYKSAVNYVYHAFTEKGHLLFDFDPNHEFAVVVRYENNLAGQPAIVRNWILGRSCDIADTHRETIIRSVIRRESEFEE